MSSDKTNPALHRVMASLLLVLSIVFISVPNTGFAFHEDRLSEKDRLEVFDKVWNLVNDRYYDPNLNGVDWSGLRQRYKPRISEAKSDLEFYDVVKKLVGEMNDVHTRFLTPREASERKLRQGTTAGILLSRVEGKIVVEKVLPDAKGELKKVKPGMEVTAIDGIPVEDRLKTVKQELGGSSSERALEIMAYRRMMRGEPGTSVRVGLIDSAGKNFEVNLVRQIVSETSEAYAKVLPSGLGYIAVTSFKSPISNKFKRALLQLRDTPSLIIDLRYNGGGSISEVLEMAGVFLNKRYDFGQFMRRDGESKQSLRKFSAGRRGRQLYSKPVIILTSKFSASGSELFASSLQELGRAKIIGSQTCGCLLGISRRHPLKGGSELHISDIGFLSAKGKVYEKIGVTPDQVVESRIDDLQSGFDRGIYEAENLLNDGAAEN